MSDLKVEIFKETNEILKDCESFLFCYENEKDIEGHKRDIVEFGINFFKSSFEIDRNKDVGVCTDISCQDSSFILMNDGTYAIPNYSNGMTRKRRTIFITGEKEPLNYIKIKKWLVISCIITDSNNILSFDYLFDKNWRSPYLNLGQCYDYEFEQYIETQIKNKRTK